MITVVPVPDPTEPAAPATVAIHTVAPQVAPPTTEMPAVAPAPAATTPPQAPAMDAPVIYDQLCAETLADPVKLAAEIAADLHEWAKGLPS